MSYRYLSIPDPRIVAFAKVKILCFLILYLLTGILIISIFTDKFTNLIGLLDTPKWRIYFGLYLIITGISTAAISSWRGKAQTHHMIKRGRVSEEHRNIHERAWKIANLIAGFIFITEGIVFVLSGIGGNIVSIRVVYTSLSGRIVILITLHLPMIAGAKIGNIIVPRSILGNE